MMPRCGACDFRSSRLLKKETVAQMFSCEFCEIYKNIFFCRIYVLIELATDVVLVFLLLTLNIFHTFF